MAAIVRRLIQLVVVLVIVTFFAAILSALLPGDPVETIAPFATAQQRTEIRDSLGLDQNIIERYGVWLGHFATGNMGREYAGAGVQGPSVFGIVKTSLPRSLLLMLYVQILTLVIAIPLGVYSAYRAGTTFDGVANGIAFGLFAIPAYVAATLLILFLSVQHHFLPSEGWVAFSTSPVEHFKHLAMPVVAITIGQFAIYARLLRTDMVATLQEDYILMAKSKGISDRRILWRHALRPSSLTLLTVAGLNVGSLISGALIIEVIFHLNGIGYQLQQAISTRQYIALQDFVAVIAIVYVLINFAVDGLYRILDPRIRVLESAESKVAGVDEIAAIGDDEEPLVTYHKGIGVIAWIAIAWIAFLLALAILAPILPIKDPINGYDYLHIKSGLFTPGHILGTDDSGNDVLSRAIWGAQASLLIGIGSVLFGTLIGGFFGLLAGFKGGPTDTVTSSLFNVFLAFPQLVLALTLVSVLSPAGSASAGWGHRVVVVILAVGIVSIPILGRITRANTLAWSQREFVMAARSQGASDKRVMFREVLPNVMPSILSIALLSVAVVIVLEGALAIFGLSIPAPSPSWGNMIESQISNPNAAPTVWMVPSFLILTTVLALNYLGDVVRKKFDVRESAL